MHRHPFAVAIGAVSLAVLLAATEGGAAPTPHRLHIQGYVTDTSGTPLASGDATVRVYTTPSGGEAIYDSAGEFVGGITGGRLDIVPGAGTALLLDLATGYWLELQVGDDVVIGEAAGGRWPFWPGGGSHARSDLELRLAALEAAVGLSSARAAPTAAAAAAARYETTMATTAAASARHVRLGLGRTGGAGAGVAVVGNLLWQPVGVFTTVSHVARLGPFYLPRPGVATAVADLLPARFALHPGRPNPFNPDVTIRFDLPRDAQVRLVIYNLGGRRIRALQDGVHQPAGGHEFRWNGRDDAGRIVPSGVYVCVLETGTQRASQRLTLVR